MAARYSLATEGVMVECGVLPLLADEPLLGEPDRDARPTPRTAPRPKPAGLRCQREGSESAGREKRSTRPGDGANTACTPPGRRPDSRSSQRAHSHPLSAASSTPADTHALNDAACPA